MEVSGKIKAIDSTKEVGSSGFQKRDIVITTDEQYPQHILIQFVQDKCALLDSFRLGESVNIGINLKGREWTNPQGETVYFNTVQGWKINRPAVQGPTAPAQNNGSAVAAYEQKHTATPTQAFEPATNLNEEEADDLPFK
jgi:hypothetical protein